MTYYLIVTKGIGYYMGYTTSKKAIVDFIKQRGCEAYTIIPYNKKDLTDDDIECIEDSDELDYLYGDIVIFRHEDDYFVESLCNYEQELGMFLHELINCMDYLRLTKKERVIIGKGLSEIYYASSFLSSDSEGDYGKVLNVKYMIEQLI
jgi:hypothetical protein